MQDNISPEERLLHLIRGEHKKPPRREKQLTEKIEVSALEKLTQQVPFIKKTREKRVSFNLIGGIVSVVFLILGIYLFTNFVITARKKREEGNLALASLDSQYLTGAGELKNEALATPVETFVSLKPVSFHKRSIDLEEPLTAAASETKQARLASSFTEIVSNLKLQGIISAPNPQAVIEDIKTKQLYFLSPGERIGGIEVKQILPTKVKLSCYGQESELKL